MHSFSNLSQLFFDNSIVQRGDLNLGSIFWRIQGDANLLSYEAFGLFQLGGTDAPKNVQFHIITP